MKHFIPYIAIIIIFGTACDKYEISSKQSESFIRFYGVGIENEGIRVITTNEGYLIMANVENPGRGKDICIITVDEYGNSTAPVKTIGGAFDDMGYTIKPREGGYIIAGSTQASQNADKDVYFLQIGTNGSVEWEKTIPHVNNNEVYDVLLEDDGDLVFTGYTEYSFIGEPTQQRDILFLKYNIERDTLLKWNRLGQSAEDEEAYSIDLDRDTTYMFAGYQTKNGTRNIFLLRWDGAGSSPLSQRITTDGHSEAKCIINTKIKDIYNDDIFLVSCNNELSPNQSEILLLETDRSIKADSIKLIGKLGERSMNSVQSMAMRGNSLYLCGTTSSVESDYGDIMLIKLTTEGLNPQYFYGGDGASYTGSGFDLTKEDGYVIIGTSYLNEKSMISLFKVNSEGSL